MTIESNLIVIVVVFIVGVLFIWWFVTHEKKSPDMDTTWYTISQRKQEILWKIHSTPSLPSGEDCDEVKRLWQEYDKLEDVERKMI